MVRNMDACMNFLIGKLDKQKIISYLGILNNVSDFRWYSIHLEHEEYEVLTFWVVSCVTLKENMLPKVSVVAPPPPHRILLRTLTPDWWNSFEFWFRCIFKRLVVGLIPLIGPPGTISLMISHFRLSENCFRGWLPVLWKKSNTFCWFIFPNLSLCENSQDRRNWKLDEGPS